MQKIYDSLYITDIDTIQNTVLTADVVISVCQDAAEDNVGCQYKHYPMPDGLAGEYGVDSSYPTFRDAVTDVVSSVRGGNRVVVHCHAGYSRSPSVCIAALAELDGYSYADAFWHIRNKRPISPSPRLVEHANKYIHEEADSIPNQQY